MFGLKKKSPDELQKILEMEEEKSKKRELISKIKKQRNKNFQLVQGMKNVRKRISNIDMEDLMDL